MSIVRPPVCLCVTVVLFLAAHRAYAGDYGREVGLIEKLGKSEAAQRAKGNQPPTLTEIKAAARTIDQYLQAAWKDHKVRPSPPADDVTFLRRVYLDIAGRIPTLEETLKFTRGTDPERRAKLIDELLGLTPGRDSEGYVHNNFTYWADLLRIQSGERPGAYGGQAFANWLKQALRENKPYDRFVYELISASGYPWENGAAGFYLRDDGMPLDHMSTTVQVFLGTSLQCAQCHDHPFDKWSQLEFYEMAAFTFSVETRSHAANFQQAMQMAKSDDAARRALEQLARPLQYGVSDGNAQLTLPHNYKYDDAKPNSSVKPFTIFGSKAEPAEGQSLRQAYAKWMIDRQNPRFTLTIANRMWKKVFGLAIVEPVDMMTDDTKPALPELMAFLSHKMEAYRYDLKQFQRMLYNTETYQRQVMTDDVPEGAAYYFPGPMLHRMSAEQFWDSIVTLIVPEADYRRGELSRARYARRMKALAAASPDQLLSLAKEEATYENQRRELRDKIKEARDAGKPQAVKALESQLQALKRPDALAMITSGSEGKDDDDLPAYKSPTAKDPSIWKGIPAHLVRASELQQPADFGSFLREFGQSDRDTINNAGTEPNIIQVLAMFNGPMFEEAIKDYSQITRNIKDTPTPIDKIRLIFLTVLNREPTDNERQAVQALVLSGSKHRNGAPDYGKIVWALLNTREFSFVR